MSEAPHVMKFLCIGLLVSLTQTMSFTLLHLVKQVSVDSRFHDQDLDYNLVIQARDQFMVK